MTNLGLFHKGLGNYPAAIEISRQALDLAIKMDKPREILESQINYASVLHAQGSNADYILAEKLLQQALKTAEEVNDFRGRCYARLGLAQIAFGLGEMEKMDEISAMLIVLAEKGEDPKITSGVYNNMAISYATNGRKEAAEVMFMKSIEKARGGGLRTDEFQYLWNASKFFADYDNYEKVSELREQAQRIYPNSLRFDQYPWNEQLDQSE